MPTPSSEQLSARAMQLVTLDSDARVIDAASVKSALMVEFDVTKQRANTAIATAARRLRNAALVADPGPADFMLRVRLSERQRERLQIMAEKETGGDISKFVRHVLFA